MIAFLALIRKDLRIFFQDRRAVIMSFVAPILIGTFFGYVFGGDASKYNDAVKAKVLVVDQDKGPAGSAIVRGMEAENALEVRRVSLEEAQDLVRKGKASVAVVIPAEFGQRAAATGKDRPKLTFYVDPSRVIESKMVQGMLTGQFLRSLGRGGPMPFDTLEVPLTARGGLVYNAYAHSYGGMAIQFILFLGIDVGIGLLLDRQRGLWKRFASSPISKWTLLGSRVVSATLIVMMILTVVFTFARIVFGVKIEGSFLGFAGICAAFGMMTSCYGLLIASIGKTPQGARGLSILATLLMVMLSGAWIPAFLFPKWLQDATKIVPARWAMDGMDGMTWRGLPFTDAVAPILVLLGFACIFGVIAVARFRWETE